MNQASVNDPKVFILMGVSATGKTTLGNALAAVTGGAFYDGDDYHPEANRQKMASGTPLNDEDRRPWLEILAQLAETRAREATTPTFIACSALKESYRVLLRSRYRELAFLHLHASPTLLRQRITERYESGEHFMPPSLLDDQLNTLETPRDALLLDVSLPVESSVTQFLLKYKSYLKTV